VQSSAVAFGELTLAVNLANLEALVEFLRDDPACRFSSLVDITAIDHPERAQRFDVVYHFLSMYRNHRIRLKRVVYEPVKLVQEYRQFDFMSPWEGAEYILPGDQKAGAK
jgi:NADH:ubiquinone oxidoreductase subunit C